MNLRMFRQISGILDFFWKHIFAKDFIRYQLIYAAVNVAEDMSWVWRRRSKQV